MNKKRSKAVYLTEVSLLLAIVILMAFTPLGYLRTGGIEITFIVVPVAIGAVVLGVKAGALLGFVFGLTSLVQCFGMSPFGTMLFNAKPFATAFCCIVPRIIVGIVPALVYEGLQKISKKRTISIAVATLLSPLTNTVLYLGCMMLFFQSYLTDAYQYTGKSGIFFFGWLLAFVSLNAILEAFASLFLGTVICKALFKNVNR